MALWTAFLLGLVGSAHCAGMCGPLALTLPVTGGARAQFVASRIIYNLGRVVTYVLMGALFGLVGKAFVLAGLQRWVSVAAGAIILLGLLVSPKLSFAGVANRFVATLKSRLGILFRRRTKGALFAIGVLNGLLPCGLAYAACAGATATGGIFQGTAYMMAFGFGTLPMMLAISLLGQRLQIQLRFKLQRLIPVSLAVVGALLLMRGLGLGIPYLSPNLPAQPDATRPCCR